MSVSPIDPDWYEEIPIFFVSMSTDVYAQKYISHIVTNYVFLKIDDTNKSV